MVMLKTDGERRQYRVGLCLRILLMKGHSLYPLGQNARRVAPARNPLWLWRMTHKVNACSLRQEGSSVVAARFSIHWPGYNITRGGCVTALSQRHILPRQTMHLDFVGYAQ